MLTRFAPSPTGRLHLGHAFSARLAWERAQGKGYLLRFEDIDPTRVKEEYYLGIEEDLRWLGISWEGEPWRQSQRMGIYREALDQLRGMGVLYPCFCTRRDLSLAAPQAGDGGQIYPGTCRDLEPEERAARMEQGAGFAWRLDMARATAGCGALFFQDGRKGQIEVCPSLLGDPILERKLVATSYHLAVVVDDAAQGIEEVVRGEDLLSSTHVHRVLQELLNLPAPQYFHHPLVVDAQGQRLAKRHDALALATLREEGWSVEAVLARAREMVAGL